MTIQQSVKCPACDRSFILETRTEKSEIQFRLLCNCVATERWTSTIGQAYRDKGVQFRPFQEKSDEI